MVRYTDGNDNLNKNYSELVSGIAQIYISGKPKAFQTANAASVETYWKIRHYIVQFEQGGESQAECGDRLLVRLSKDLSLSYGRGCSLSDIKRFRQFYLAYPIGTEP